MTIVYILFCRLFICGLKLIKMIDDESCQMFRNIDELQVSDHKIKITIITYRLDRFDKMQVSDGVNIAFNINISISIK